MSSDDDVLSNNNNKNDIDESSSSNTKQQQEHQRWFPLESNPTLINEYISKLGFNTLIYEFIDVYSYEDWALEMISQPVIAVLFLYPLTSKQLQYHDPPEDIIGADSSTSNLWFMKQRIGNACGTIGILHAIINNVIDNNDDKKELLIQSNSWFDQFIINTKQTNAIEKAEILEKDEQIASFHDHATSSIQNATSRGTIDDDIITHFIAFVEKDNMIYEFDGRKDGPICHGPISTNLLKDSCQKVIAHKFIKRDPDELRFTIIALAPNNNQE